MVSDPILQWYQNKYNIQASYVVRNVPEESALKRFSLADHDLRLKCGVPNTARLFIYQGLISRGRGVELLVESFKQLSPSKAHLVFMGYCDKSVKSFFDKSIASVPNIHHHPPVSRDLIISHSSTADVGLIICERSSLSYRYALSNKFYEYSHAGLPILVSDNLTYQSSLLASSQSGWSVPLSELISELSRISDLDLTDYSSNALSYSASAIWESDAAIFSSIYK